MVAVNIMSLVQDVYTLANNACFLTTCVGARKPACWQGNALCMHSVHKPCVQCQVTKMKCGGTRWGGRSPALPAAAVWDRAPGWRSRPCWRDYACHLFALCKIRFAPCMPGGLAACFYQWISWPALPLLQVVVWVQWIFLSARFYLTLHEPEKKPVADDITANQEIRNNQHETNYYNL